MNPSVPPPPTKQGICKSISQGKPLPTKLCTSFAKLNSKIDAKDAKYNRLASHMDDEYGNAGWNHQHGCATILHLPSLRLKQFAKAMKLLILNLMNQSRESSYQ
ncbi:hypothetical protein ACHAWX_000147 [Stephanocyclus meneghinianus]